MMVIKELIMAKSETICIPTSQLNFLSSPLNLCSSPLNLCSTTINLWFISVWSSLNLWFMITSKWSTLASILSTVFRKPLSSPSKNETRSYSACGGISLSYTNNIREEIHCQWGVKGKWGEAQFLK